MRFAGHEGVERGLGTGRARLRGPVVASVLLHMAAVAILFLVRPAAPMALPPTYRVDLVAAPPGERRAGVVRPPASEPAPEQQPDAAPPPRAETPEQTMPAPPTEASEQRPSQ
ncbi:MAG: hypothetical protein ACRENI_12320, partial [Gemmatimonadaceae bacterium]